MARKRVTEEMQTQMVTMAEEGATLREIGARIGVHSVTVKYHLNKLGLQTKDNRGRSSGKSQEVQEEVADKIVQLYVEEELNMEQVSAKTSVVKSTVRNVLLRRGVKPRDNVKRHLLSPQQKSALVRKYKEGATYIDLSNEYGISTNTVGNVLHASGVKTRTGWRKYRVSVFKDRLGRVFRFRSSWEKKYAEWLDSQGWSWDYEPRSYSLKECRCYTPDFVLYADDGADLRVVEVKGWLDDRTIHRLREFCLSYPLVEVDLVGPRQMVKLGLVQNSYTDHPQANRVDLLREELGFRFTQKSLN